MTCRLCLKKDKILIPVFDEFGVDSKCIAAIISNYIGVKLHINDKISNQICCNCWSSIENFQRFCISISEKQNKLRDFGLGGMPAILLLDRSDVPGDVKLQFVGDDNCGPDTVILKSKETYTDTADESECDEPPTNVVKCNNEQVKCLTLNHPSSSNVCGKSKTRLPDCNSPTRTHCFAYPSSSCIKTKTTICRPDNLDVNMDSNIQDIELYHLLKEWDLSNIYNVLLEHKIDTSILKIMKSKHIDKLLESIPMKDQILFEYNFDKWRHDIGAPAICNKEDNNITETRNNSPSQLTSNEESKYSLRKILKDTVYGKMIVKYYDQNKSLHEEQRTLLINTIARYIEADGCNLSLGESAQIEKEIIEMFPTEKLEFYTTGKRGRIYNKVANLKRTSKPLTITTQNSTLPSIEFTPESDAEDIVDILRGNNNISEDKFLQFWKKCCQYRFRQIVESNSIEEIITKWPEYKQSIGLQLINIDFALKYTTATSLLTIWHEKVQKLEELLISKVNSSTTSEILQRLSSCSEDSRDLIVLWALHHLFPPTQKSFKDATGAKVKRRFSIADSQQSFLISGKSLEEIDNKLKIIKLREKHIPPCLMLVGELADAKEVYIYFNDIRFPMLHSLEAADVCFKIFYVFNLEYPEESCIFYNFIQTFFYNIPPLQKNTRISTLINELNSMN